MTTERSPADAEREHQEAFGTLHPWVVELVDRVRDDDPTLTDLDLFREYKGSFLSDGDLHWTDMAWELLGRYVAANTYLESIALPYNTT